MNLTLPRIFILVSMVSPCRDNSFILYSLGCLTTMSTYLITLPEQIEAGGTFSYTHYQIQNIPLFGSIFFFPYFHCFYQESVSCAPCARDCNFLNDLLLWFPLPLTAQLLPFNQIIPIAYEHTVDSHILHCPPMIHILLLHYPISLFFFVVKKLKGVVCIHCIRFPVFHCFFNLLQSCFYHHYFSKTIPVHDNPVCQNGWTFV